MLPEEFVAEAITHLGYAIIDCKLFLQIDLIVRKDNKKVLAIREWVFHISSRGHEGCRSLRRNSGRKERIRNRKKPMGAKR
jgi:hypothetical protein